MKSIHSDNRGQKKLPLWNVVVLTLVLNYWLHILELVKKNWNGQVKKQNLQPIEIFIFCMVYINIIETW